MISTSVLFWVAAGLAAGGAHSIGIGNSATKTNLWAGLIGMLRLFVVGVVLTVAAIFGYLFSAVAGWIVGFILTLVVLFWRGR